MQIRPINHRHSLLRISWRKRLSSGMFAFLMVLGYTYDWGHIILLQLLQKCILNITGITNETHHKIFIYIYFQIKSESNVNYHHATLYSSPFFSASTAKQHLVHLQKLSIHCMASLQKVVCTYLLRLFQSQIVAIYSVDLWQREILDIYFHTLL